MTEVAQLSLDSSSNPLETEVKTLRKQIRSQESEWKKNKAVLEQRIEILELQNRELKEREENLKKMNNSIFSALKDFNKENDPAYTKVIKDLEEAKQQISLEYADYKARTQEIIKAFEKETKELKEKVVELDAKCNNVTLHYEKNDATLQQKLQNLENEKKNLTVIAKLYEDERKQYRGKEIEQTDFQSKINELRDLLDKQGDDHRKELDKIHKEYAQKINNMKYFNESEKATLESQIHKLLDSKKLEGTLFEDLKKNYERESSLLKKERDDSFKRNETLEQQNSQLIDQVKALETKLVQQKTEHDKESKELKRLRSKVTDFDTQLRKYEHSEKSLKLTITEKENKLEELTAEYKKKLNNEKRKYEQANELVKRYREESDKKCSFIIQESIKKDEVIKKLKNQSHQSKLKEERSASKNDAEVLKASTTSISNLATSLSQLNSATKAKTRRLYGQEIKTHREPNFSKSVIQAKKSTSRLHRDYTQKNIGASSFRETLPTNEDEEDPKDLTDENILLTINSPRTNNGTNTFRDYSSATKRELDFSVLTGKAQTHSNLKQHQNGGDTKRSDNSTFSVNAREPRLNFDSGLKGVKYHGVDNRNLLNSSLDYKKKSASFCDSDLHFQNDKPTRDGDMKKMTSVDLENSHSFMQMNDFGENVNLVMTQNQILSNVPRSFREIVENVHKASLQRNHHDFEFIPEEMSQTRSTYEEEKIRFLEDKLRAAEFSNEKIGMEKEKLQVELDRLILELKQTKMEWALSEESKEECELTLKNEIKFLINKLLQLKSTGSGMGSLQGYADFLQQSRGLGRNNLDVQSSINNSDVLNLSHLISSKHFGSFVSTTQEQKNMNIVNNNYDLQRGCDSAEKEPTRDEPRLYPEFTETPLKVKCINMSLEMSESPQKMNEYHKNENNLLRNILSKSTNSKKLLKGIKP